MVDGISDKTDQPGRTQRGQANQEEVRKAASTYGGGSRQDSGLEFDGYEEGYLYFNVRFTDGKNSLFRVAHNRH